MRRTAAFLAAQALGLALATAQAQVQVQAQAPTQLPTPPLPGNQPGQPPELPRPGFAPAAPPGLFELPPVPALPAPAATPGPAHPLLRRVEFSGNTAVPGADLQAAAAPWLQRPAGEEELEALRQQLTRVYVERGYVNSGLLLREVDAAAGVARFEAVEGRLAAVEPAGLDGLHPDYLVDRLQRSGDGPLNLELLRERFQLLLGDPLFERLNARLVPGLVPGQAVLLVDVQRARPWDFTLFANNYRPVSTGAAALGASGTVRNLTGRGDVLDATLQTATARSDPRATLGWRMPLGGHGTQLQLGYDHGASSLLEESVRALDIESRLTSREIGLAQTLHETLGRRIAIGASRVWRDNRTTLLGEPFSFVQGEPEGHTRERLWRFWQELALRSQTQVLALRSTFSWGRNNVQQEQSALPSAGLFPSRYRAWLGQAQYVHQLRPDGLQLVLRGSVQRSGDRLLALDGMAIGGVATVRGYRENQIVRDQGEVLSVELEAPVLRDGERGLRLVAVPFVDLGRGRNHGEAATTLKSAGLATRLQWDRLSVDLTLARRLGQPAWTRSQGSNLQDKGVHLQVAYKF